MHYDALIVGAGSAGCVLESRLSKVLQLEVGPDYLDVNSPPSEIQNGLRPTYEFIDKFVKLKIFIS